MHSQFQPQLNQNAYRQAPQPATPAPSPPPSPSSKPKKQQYQTDQSRPFLFPFSRTQAGKEARLVPFAIDEADRLYNKHMYVGLALAQMWRTREDCMTAESGLDHMPGTEGEFKSSTFNPDVSTLFHQAVDSISLIKPWNKRRRRQESYYLTPLYWIKKSKKLQRP